MKLKLAGMSLMLFWVCSVIAQSSPVRTGQDLRIMSYNIHNGMGLDGQGGFRADRGRYSGGEIRI